MLTSVRNFLLLALGVTVLAGVFYLMMKASGTTPTSASAGAYRATTTMRAASDFAWRIEQAPDYSDTMPNQLVSLMVGTTTYPIGTYQGCVQTPTNVPLEPNELTRQTCWFGGAGTDIGLFFENGVHVVKARWTQEVPPDVDAEPHGPFETVLTL